LIIEKIQISGLTKLSSEEIIKALNLPGKPVYNQEETEYIKDKLYAVLERNGFYFARVELADIVALSKDKIMLSFNIDEGYSGYLSDLRFTGNKYFSDDKLIQVLGVKDISSISIRQLPSIKNSILNLYTSRGFLFTQIVLDTLSVINNQLSAVIRIDEGPLFRFKNYVIKGNAVTKPDVVMKITGLKQNALITPEILTQAEDNLLRKAYIKSSKIIPLNSNTLGIEIEEDRMTTLQGVFGYNKNPNTQKRTINGLFNLQFLNLWGTDRALSLYWKSIQDNYQTLELSYHESGHKDYPLAGDIGFHRTEQDTFWIRVKAELSIYYNTLFYKLGTYLSSENIYPVSQDTGVEITTNYGIGLLFDYSKTDYFPNPTIGNKLKLKSGILFRQENNDNKIILVTEIDVIRYIPLFYSFVSSLELHYREISNADAKEFEQYKMGGFNSVRGYYEDTFNSWRLGWINSEIRCLMTKDSRIYIFLDYGIVQMSKERTKSDIWGSGIGFAIKTRAGILSISYALNYTNRKLSSFENGMLHMGVENSF